ncbi:MAG: peptidoglycan bridge formation glycyltransferase FemA/FemB family protein [Candidatus Andersenbacteria bacterium]|nr:peptidoglycan bridge formation glycyltransferase FemA/FemB family protein [Candidatus Andersenbacteria bacterium]
MTIEEITTENAWQAFISRQDPNTFLQSWAWGQVQQKDGEHVRYLGFFEHGIQVACALVISVHARRGTHYLIPHGPIFSPQANQTEVVKQLTQYLAKEAAKESAVCIRIAPLIEESSESKAIFKDAGYQPSPLHVHAELTWVLDISKSPEEILLAMRKTSRHAIKKGEAQIQVEIHEAKAGFERFWPLYEATTDRHNFVPFSRPFISAQVEEFSRDGSVYIPIAKYQGQDVAAAIILISGSTAFYYHGASVKLTSSVPAAHVLQWHSIQEGRRRRLKRYNFWGIAPEGKNSHPFAGITVFKKGFGGRAINYLHAQDYPLSFGYKKLWLVETIRKFKRGF